MATLNNQRVAHIDEFIAEYCNTVCACVCLHICVLIEIPCPIENAAYVPKEKLRMNSEHWSSWHEFSTRKWQTGVISEVMTSQQWL